MYYYEDSAEKDLSSKGYQKITRKPWNVREGDVIVLHHWATGPHVPEHWIPVEITLTDKHAEYHRSDVIPNQYTKVSRTTYQFSHKALYPDLDNKHLFGWWSTRWYSYDDVEIWRPTTPKK